MMHWRVILCILALLFCSYLTLLTIKRRGGSKLVSWFPSMASSRDRLHVFFFLQREGNIGVLVWHWHFLWFYEISVVCWMYTPHHVIRFISRLTKLVHFQVNQIGGQRRFCTHSSARLDSVLSSVLNPENPTFVRMCFAFRLPAQQDVHQTDPYRHPCVWAD